MLRTATQVSDSTLGDAQGGAIRDGKIYLFGDLTQASPRVGVIREYDLNLVPTGRSVTLTRGGVPLLTHPTGLTFDPRFGTFLGDTVGGWGAFFKSIGPRRGPPETWIVPLPGSSSTTLS